MSKRKLVVHFHGGGTPNTKQTFDDWFDFADYCKQENERGLVVHILRWEYL